MDPTRFDAVTKRLATGGTSRRRLLTGVGGALGATLLGVTGAAADNQCKPSGPLPQSKCNKNAQCCSGVCFDGECCTPLTTCPADQCGQSISDGCGGTVDCPPCPVTCSAGSCPSGGPACTAVPGCSTNPGCLCYLNVEGATVCVDANIDCRTLPTCNISADCPAGSSCIDVFCACGPSGPKRCYPCCAT